MRNVSWIAFCALLRKEIARVFRIWPQTLFPPCMTAALYFVIFGGVIGQHVGTMAGVSYMAFLVPGFIMMNAIMNAYSNVSSSYFGAKFQNNIDELLIAPISPQLIMWAYMLAGIIRGGIIGAAVLLIATLFVKIHIAHIFLAILVLLLSMIVFSLAGFINAVYAKKFDDVMFVPNFVIVPLTYLGGVFYSIHNLPAFWQEVAKFNPVFYLIDAFRYAMIDQSDVSIWMAFGFVIGLFAIFYVLGLRLLKTSDGLRS